MYSAIVVAGHFVNLGIGQGKPVTQMKLQKIVYFAHGLHLALYGEKLVSEDFQAWRFGPVIPDIYQTYKQWGNSAIITESRMLFVADNQTVQAKPALFTASAQRAIDLTWKITKELDGISLSQWTHEPDSPWSQAYEQLGGNWPIPNEWIKSYFEKIVNEQTPAA